MKICFVSHSSAKMGAERALLEIIDVLRARKIECFAILPSAGPLAAELKTRSIPIAILPYPWWVDFKWRLSFTPLIRVFLSVCLAIPVALYIKRWKADIVYTNTVSVCAGAFAARMLKRPHIWHLSEFGYEDHRFMFELGENITFKIMNGLTSHFIAVSEAVANKFRKYIPDSKLTVVYYAVEVPKSASYPPARIAEKNKKMIRCAMVGRVNEGKGPEDAIQAVAVLKRKKVGIELAIVGNAQKQYRNKLSRLIREEEVEGIVTLCPYVDDPIPTLLSADVVLMCSRCEAFGRVTVEAMKVGKPVIGTRSGGTTELIREGFNGLFYTAGDYEELAERIKFLYDHQEQTIEMGRNAKAWALQNFNANKFGDDLLSVLSKVS